MINLKRNLLNSLHGLSAAWADRSWRAQIFLGLLLIPAIVLTPAPLSSKLALLFNYVLVLVAELLNTALEKLCDRVTTEIDPAIKAVKDMASAAVFLLLLALAAHCIYFWLYR